MIDPNHFSHLGFGVPDTADITVDGHDAGGLHADPLGQVHHIGLDGVDHGQITQDHLGVLHFQNHGVPAGSASEDPQGNLHVHDNAHREIGQITADPLGHHHFVDAGFHEFATSTTDALGQTHLDHAATNGLVPDPFAVFNDLLNEK